MPFRSTALEMPWKCEVSLAGLSGVFRAPREIVAQTPSALHFLLNHLLHKRL